MATEGQATRGMYYISGKTSKFFSDKFLEARRYCINYNHSYQMEHSISGKKTGVPKERNSRKVLVVCSGPQEMVKVLFKKKDQKKRTATSRLECLRRTRKIVLRYLKKFRTSAGVSFSKIVKINSFLRRRKL